MERYEKVRVIGQGAFGKVYLCRRRVDKSHIVIKQIPVDELQKEERKSAMNEVDVLSMLKHPNIVGYLDSFMDDKSLMIAMEYAPGGTLYELIQERDGRLMQEERILQLFAQVLVAIEHVHSRNILHRDLKTQNIMLNKSRTVVKIGDFGISKVLSSKITSAKTVVGTPCYISPEICEGRVYRRSSDIWALGCILYELTTLNKAFEGPSLPSLVLKIMQAAAAVKPIPPHFSQGLRDIISSMLKRNPEDRPNIENIMATPIMVNVLVNLGTDVGRLPCTRPAVTEQSGRVGPRHGAVGVRMGSVGSYRQFSFLNDDVDTRAQPRGRSKPQVFLWGGGVPVPQLLSHPPESVIIDVAIGRSQRIGITEDGRLILWELSSGSLNTTRFTMTQSQRPSSKRARPPLIFQPRLLEGLSNLMIQKVSCGDLFTACLTDKGILMTFGSGMSGCLGHGNFEDVVKPKLVEQMLQYETIDIACGGYHMLAITSEKTVHSWGRGDCGQLGIGSTDTHCSPQPVPLSNSVLPKHVFCGSDCSMVITNIGAVLSTGCNRYNKIALDSDTSKSSSNAKEDPVQDDDDTPLILKLADQMDQSDLSKTSLILSSLRFSTKTASTPSGEDEIVKSRSRRHVDKTLVFQHTGSPLLESDVAKAALGTNHTAFIKTSGECVTCGANTYGQLGYQRQSGHTQPAVVDSLVGQRVQHISCGDTYTAACTDGGEVYSWGRARRGRLGRDVDQDTAIPHAIPFESSHSLQSLASSHSVTLLLSTPKK